MKHWILSLSENHYQKIYLAGLFLFAVGLPLSKSLMTIAQMILSVHWLLSAGYLRLPRLKSSVGIAFYSFLAIYLLHLFGLFHSIDLQYAAKDLRIKLPLLLLPLFMVCAPIISRSMVYALLKTFVVAVLAGSFVSLYLLLTVNPVDPRELTPFISHIRFSMMVSIAVTIIFYFAMQSENSLKRRMVSWIGVAWFMVFLVLLEALTGIVAMLLVVFVTMIFLFSDAKKTWCKLLFGVFLLAFTGLLAVPVIQAKRELLPDIADLTLNLEAKTSAGNSYLHNTSSPVNENGNLVWLYVCEDEMRSVWNNRSAIHYDSVDPAGSRKGDVLMRYLSSKGLRKDSCGVSALTDTDIEKIEKGITNFRYGRWNGMKRRFDELKWEYWQYKGGGKPSGHSILQRMELWKVGWTLAMENPWTGVGTGDVKREFASQLKEHDSSLSGSPMRAHNQYLTLLIAFGFSGLILFLAALITPLIILRKRMNYVFLVFVLLMMLSMFTEDTLETQVGVSLFSFFLAFWLFQKTDIPFPRHLSDHSPKSVLS